MTDNPGISDAYRFILLRHGESVGNAEGRVQGQADFPLTDKGRLQTHSLAKRWRAEGISFDRVISSPQLRSRETAEIISGALDIPIEFDPVWMERDYGTISGASHTDAVRLEGHPLYAYPFKPVGETGESLWDLYLRGGQAVRGLLTLAPGHYLVVSHGGILNMTLYAILGIVSQAYLRGASFRFRNTGYATLSYNPSEHMWRLEGFNDNAHRKANH